MNLKNKPTTKSTASNKHRFIWGFLPLLLFIGLTIVFLTQLLSNRDPQEIPSALIDQPIPNFDLPALEGITLNDKPMPGLKQEDLKGHVSLVNIWASWCGPCRQEHPILMQLAKDKRFRLVGINYKDKAKNARRFLETLGNPYVAVGADTEGRIGIEWGVYGIPETFIVDRFGCIAYKFIGPLNSNNVKTKLLPIIENTLKRDKPPKACQNQGTS